MKFNQTRVMNVGRTSRLVGALIAGALTPACTAPDDMAAGDEMQTTQSALKVVSSVTAVATPVKVIQLPPSLPQWEVLPPPHQVCGKTVRIPSADLEGGLEVLLGGSRIVYDTTGTSDTLVGPYYHCWYPNDDALQAAITECIAGPAQNRGACLAAAHDDHPQIKECASTTGAYHSYIDFGPFAELNGAEDMFFDSDRIRRVNWAGTFDLDINFLRTTINNTTLAAKFTKDPASDKAIANVSLEMSSNNPTIKCQGGLPCPDVNLSNMKVDAQFPGIAPTADRTQLAFEATVVTFQFDKNINNVPDWFVDLIKDVDAMIRDRVKKRLESALNKPGTRAALDNALTEMVEHFAGQQITTFYDAWFENGDLVVDYQPAGRLAAVATGCMEATASP